MTCPNCGQTGYTRNRAGCDGCREPVDWFAVEPEPSLLDRLLDALASDAAVMLYIAIICTAAGYALAAATGGAGL